MKKVFFILSIALLGLSSCSKVGMGDLQPVLEEEMEAEGPKVEVTFSVPSSVRTKAMADKPQIQTMHVAVFNAAGKLKEFEQARLTDVTLVNGDNGQEARDTYTVILTMAKTKRTLHFIANSPITSLDDFESTTGEDNVLSELVTSLSDEPSDAYWQRKELPNGITAYTYPGGALNTTYVTGTPMVDATYYAEKDTEESQADPLDPQTDDMSTAIRYKYKVGNNTYEVSKGDFICRDGSKVMDDTGYFASVEVSNVVASIPLIRNFARITVSAPADTKYENGAITGSGNFVPVQFTVINTPTLGFVAPYDPNKKAFVQPYLNATTHTAITHEAIQASEYPGNMPSSAALNTDTSSAAFVPLDGDDPYFYAYERPIPTNSPVTILVQGYKIMDDESAEEPVQLRWFKIEFTAVSGDYIPIYRGCVYNTEITSITGSDGYGEMAEALSHPAIGDISGSTETENLTTISKGGFTLWVEYIGYAHVGAAKDVKLRYKFFNEAGTSLSTVTLALEGYGSAVPAAVLNYSTGTESEGIGPDGKTGWYETTVSLDATGTATKKSALVVTGTGTAGGVTTTLYRRVVYSVLPKTNFDSVTNDGLVTDTAGSQTTVTAVLPPNLPFSMFPLHIAFESNNNNINPVDDIPVQSGKSFADTGKGTFYFVKTVNWSEYDVNTGATVTATFKTTKDNAVTGNDATTTKIYVGDVDGFFNSRPTTLYKKEFGVSPTNFTVKGTDTSVNFDIVVNSENASNVHWEITGSEGVQITPATSGSASSTITMSFPQNTTRQGEEGAKTNNYQATVKYSYTAGGENVEGSYIVNVKQNPQVLVTRTVDVPNAVVPLANSATYTVTDTQDPSKTIEVGNRTNLAWNNSGYLYTSNNGGASIVFTPTEGVSITGLTFTWNNNYRPSSNGSSVTPQGGNAQSMSINDQSGTWSGSETGPLTVNLPRRNNGDQIRISGIRVSYSYNATVWE